MQNFLSGIIRFIIKLVLAAFGLVFAISLLLVALIVMVLSLFKSLITWTKPAPFVAFTQFRQFRQATRGGWGAARKPMPKGDVLDVEVREIPRETDDKRQS